MTNANKTLAGLTLTFFLTSTPSLTIKLANKEVNAANLSKGVSVLRRSLRSLLWMNEYLPEPNGSSTLAKITDNKEQVLR